MYWWPTTKFVHVDTSLENHKVTSVWGQLEQQTSKIPACLVPYNYSPFITKNHFYTAQHKTVTKERATGMKKPVSTKDANQIGTNNKIWGPNWE